MIRTKILAVLVLALGLMVCPTKVSGQVELGTAFTYQGFLKDLKKDKPADGGHDFEFALFESPDPNIGVQVGSTFEANDVNVIHGYFMVRLDFGADVFAGYERWLQIAVRETDSGDLFTDLAPRLELTLTPYAIYALSAEDANTVDGHDANAFAASVHNHDGSDINSGTVAEAYIDGTITRDSELDSGLAGKADVGHAHDDNYYTEMELQTSGSANVHWDNLLATMPAGFADGVDNEGGVPLGVIVMWSGSIASIPGGWALCDGGVHNGVQTPDLRNRFIVGARQDVGDVAMTAVKGSLLQIGGEHQHTLTIAEMPSHTHEESGHGGWPGCACGGDPVGAQTKVQTGPAGGGQPHENCPPFYALAFIMKLP